MAASLTSTPSTLSSGYNDIVYKCASTKASPDFIFLWTVTVMDVANNVLGVINLQSAPNSLRTSFIKLEEKLQAYFVRLVEINATSTGFGNPYTSYAHGNGYLLKLQVKVQDQADDTGQTDTIRYVLPAKLNKLQLTTGDFLGNMSDGALTKFLQGNSYQKLYQEGFHLLTFFHPKTGITDTACRLRVAIKTNLNPGGWVYSNFARNTSFSPYNPITFKVSYEQLLNFRNLDEGEFITSAEFRVELDSGTILSETAVFKIDYKPNAFSRMFVWHNSQGGFSASCFTGIQEKKGGYQKEVTRRGFVLDSDSLQKGVNISYNYSDTQEITVNTGVKLPQELALIAEIFKSRKAFVVDDVDLLPIVVTNSDVSLALDLQFINSYDIVYSYDFDY